MPRLFTAIAVSKHVDRYLDNVILNSEPLNIQPVKHITLCFIGHVSIPTAMRIEKDLSRVKGKVFDVTIEGCELFKPNSSKPILVATVKPNQALTSLYQKLGNVLTEQGVALDSRSYKPHITLVRFNSPSPEQIKHVMQRATAIKASFKVTEFVLYGVDRTLPSPYFKQREYQLANTVS